MKTVQDLISPLLSKKLEITIANEKTNLLVIDWKTIEEKHEEVMEETSDLDDEELGEYLMENETELIQITEYFMNDACDEKVEDEKWYPFGLLGLTHHPDSYAETGHAGLLLLDLSKGNLTDPPVLLFKGKKAQVIAPAFSTLAITVVK